MSPQLIVGDRQQRLGLLEHGQQCGANQRGVESAAGARRSFARRLGGGGRQAQRQRSQAVLANPQAFAAMMANPQAFAAASQSAAALAALSSNQKAWAALAAQPNLAALMANPSFSAALNQAGVSQSHAD